MYRLYESELRILFIYKEYKKSGTFSTVFGLGGVNYFIQRALIYIMYINMYFLG